MRIELTDDPVEFRRRAGEFLSRDPLRNTVVATAVENFSNGLSDGRAHFAAVAADGAVVGVGMQTGGHSVYLGDVPDSSVSALVTAFAERAPGTPGVEAAPGIALVFAERWSALRGSKFRMDFASRLYRLGVLRPPEVSGTARRAVDADLDVCERWLRDMQRETGVGLDRAAIRVRIALGRLWLWEDGGRPVALAAHQARAYGWSRIGPVYTPPEARRNGYAAALTAHVSQWLRDKGSRVCLFTDLANPTSNKIYQEIGYEPVHNFVHYLFE
ncbi:GNAT family N-acetyltransferase [Nocardia sp. CDC159]|uniref:GNAT family N-acetyltransferase n=1 Tax=Nocardia pulmonis TaxID=2951408 RepID=A0A9X2IX88_9NOCA|nr:MULTISPECIES: GNAT family N-acetyltransferase [Nocardia]MCM6775777.1 GNAT family N-acetyltransferase [Nocardia pulmonis]MCM6788247.1 GNAT family N-acetyltransferase [Nocardia sp. CDC159]